jgi:hypothetical protein
MLQDWLSQQKDLPLPPNVLSRMCSGRLGNLIGEKKTHFSENRQWVKKMIENWLEEGKLALISSALEILDDLDNEKKRLEKEMNASIRKIKDIDPNTREKMEGEGLSDLSGAFKLRLDLALFTLSSFFRDILILKCNIPQSNLTHQDCLPLLKKMLPKINNPEEKLRKIDQTRRNLEGNINQKLTLEMLLLQIFN